MFALSTIRVQTTRRLATCGFSASAMTKKDILQDMYLKEIRNYKPDAKAAKADVTTKEFTAPKVPEAPKNDINLEADMKTYEQTGALNQ
ncbi:ATP synthase complex subunit H-domain-containing protein [Coemansia mojavensis]|nr:ATP synthase complex subunit H-domain-containing protein [Coemansia mojavensis]